MQENNSNFITLPEMYGDPKKNTETKCINKAKPDFKIVNFNNACNPSMLSVPLMAQMNWAIYLGVCDGRGSNILERNNDYLIDETKNLIRRMINIKSDSEIIFTSNGTLALYLANEIIYNYVNQNENYATAEKNIFIHPLAHNSLRVPMQKYKKLNNSKIVNYDKLPKYFLPDQVNIVGLPYIDNLIGEDHWPTYIGMIKNKIVCKQSTFQTKTKKFGWCPKHSKTSLLESPLYTILDACQGIPNIMFSSNAGENNKQLSKADAIVFSAHKMHSSNLGVLIIKKKFLHNLINLDYNNLPSGGGSILSYDDETPIYKTNQSSTIQGGVQNSASIIALGALLQNIKDSPYIYKHLLNNKVEVLAEMRKTIPSFYPILELTKQGSYPNNSIINVTSKYLPLHDLYLFLNDLSYSRIGKNKSKLSFQTRDGECCVHYGYSKLGLNNTLRFSFSIDNSVSEVVECCKQIKEYLAYYNLYDLHNDCVKIPKQAV